MDANLEIIAKEWQVISNEEKLLIEKKEKFMSKLEENNLYINDKNEIQEKK